MRQVRTNLTPRKSSTRHQGARVRRQMGKLFWLSEWDKAYFTYIRWCPGDKSRSAKIVGGEWGRPFAAKSLYTIVFWYQCFQDLLRQFVKSVSSMPATSNKATGSKVISENIFNPSLTRPLDEVRQAFLYDMQFLEGQRWCGAAVKLFSKNQKCFVESEQKKHERYCTAWHSTSAMLRLDPQSRALHISFFAVQLQLRPVHLQPVGWSRELGIATLRLQARNERSQRSIHRSSYILHVCHMRRDFWQVHHWDDSLRSCEATFWDQCL